MRLKTLGVGFILVLAFFLAFYWLTDQARMDARTEEIAVSEHEFALRVFGPPEGRDPEDTADDFPAAANCARCHGAEGEGGPIPGDPNGRQAPSLRTERIADRLAINPEYVNLVIRFGGIVASGDPRSPMPAWDPEVGGPLTDQQIDALTALVEGWAAEAAAEAAENEGAEEQPVENTAEVGAEVYTAAGCSSCHGVDLEGVPDLFPGLTNIGNEPILNDGLPTDVVHEDLITADYEADPREFLRKWIRDSAANYNEGNDTGMPPFPEEELADDELEALITFLLEQQQ